MKLFAYAFALILASACAADRDAQDFQNEQALRDIARVNEIAGKYSGRLENGDGELLGMMTVELRASSEVTPGGSGQIGAGLRTAVTIRTARSVSIAMEEGYYDWRSRTFKAEQAVNIDGSTTYTAEISGSFEDDDTVLRGELQIQDFPESVSNFVLKKNRRIRPEETPGEDADELSPGETWEYEGEFNDDTDIRMAIQSDSNSRLQEFIEFLAPVKYVNVTIGFPGFAVNFPNTFWDLSNNTLAGIYKNGEFQVRLNCESENESEYWTCRYFRSNTTSTTVFTVTRDRN